LVAEYPDFYDLIHGILNPIDINVGVRSPDNGILFVGGYSRVESIYGGFQFQQNATSTFIRNNLIEFNETNIVFKLQDWIDVFMARWYNQDYSAFNEFYYPVVLSILYAMIPGLIHNFRLQNCHTDAAHSYHINEYLESHGYLYFPASKLPHAQRLWLYRNVRSMYNALGVGETFHDIIDNIFTPAAIPLAGYQLKQNTVNLPDEQFPLASVTKQTINFNQVGSGKERLELISLMRRQASVARSNLPDIDFYQSETKQLLDKGDNNAYVTSTLDSQMLDLTDISPYPIT
jgi:hypothetical protein